MSVSNLPMQAGARGPAADDQAWSPEHLLHILLHRKLIVLGIWVAISAATALVVHFLPDLYSSETVILVDPQKVPETYVKSTVSGDVRNRLGTLSQQILSATRLQRIIDSFGLYAKEKKELAREDVIAKMRKDITVSVVGDVGGSQNLEAFRIGYQGRDPRLVAQVANQLASLFIEENLKAREEEATGTTEFLGNQLQEAKKTLDDQEAKLRDFKLQHIGEMPEQQTTDLQILGQLQSQLQLESDALNRAQQQQGYLQSMMAQSMVVVDLGERDVKSAAPTGGGTTSPSPAASPANNARARLAQLLLHYTENHPEVRKLKAQIAEEEAKTAAGQPVDEPKRTTDSSAAEVPRAAAVRSPSPANNANPVLESQLRSIEAEIAKHKQEQARLGKLVAEYQKKLEAIPVREQQIASLARDYEMSKTHYAQLLDKQLSAETATQLEIRQKGERFEVLDPAQPAQRPSSPNRPLINIAGSLVGLVLALGAAVGREFFSLSITGPKEVTAATNLPVLQVIPVIQTSLDLRRRRKLVRIAVISLACSASLSCAALFYFYRNGF